MELWHGSERRGVQPVFGTGNPRNDFGLGFYCTRDKELAKEWACTERHGGYANRYELDESGLTVLDLQSDVYHALNWLAVLLENRIVQPGTPVALDGIDYIRSNFAVDLTRCDVIRGYRADDSYFSFARAFVSNQISVAQLGSALRLGKLGEQIVIKSERAFRAMSYVGCEPAKQNRYLPMRTKRDEAARAEFRELTQHFDRDGLYLADIMREGVSGDDERLHV